MGASPKQLHKLTDMSATVTCGVQLLHHTFCQYLKYENTLKEPEKRLSSDILM